MVRWTEVGHCFSNTSADCPVNKKSGDKVRSVKTEKKTNKTKVVLGKADIRVLTPVLPC